tara:strand:- start:43 stop:210 length:168 start_codon:yes stop_codon:yes gene_type:complete
LRLTAPVFAVYALLQIVMIWKIIGTVLQEERANSLNLMDNIGPFVFFLVAAFYWQ